MYTTFSSIKIESVCLAGANSGIGKVTARDLYRRGAEVVMLCRNLTKAEKTADQVK